jgi:ribosomal protein L12E/L44/L45/RPP1/RPP2
MTEQEKQTDWNYLNDIAEMIRVPVEEIRMSHIAKALFERDREVERYKESNAVLVISNNSREEEKQRLRKALERLGVNPDEE